jgi:hypothetical protein
LEILLLFSLPYCSVFSRKDARLLLLCQPEFNGNPDNASGWKNKLKQAVAVINKQLVPLKLTMLLYYYWPVINSHYK